MLDNCLSSSLRLLLKKRSGAKWVSEQADRLGGALPFQIWCWSRVWLLCGGALWPALDQSMLCLLGGGTFSILAQTFQSKEDAASLAGRRRMAFATVVMCGCAVANALVLHTIPCGLEPEAGLILCTCAAVVSLQHTIDGLHVWKTQLTEHRLQHSVSSLTAGDSLLDHSSDHIVDSSTVFGILEELSSLANYVTLVMLKLTPACKTDTQNELWREHPQTDPRGHACVWVLASVRGVIESLSDGQAVSFTSLQMLHLAVVRIHAAINEYVNYRTRQTLVEGMAIIFHATRRLPVPTREALDQVLMEWKRMCDGDARDRSSLAIDDGSSSLQLSSPGGALREVMRLLLDEPAEVGTVEHQAQRLACMESLQESIVPDTISCWNDSWLATIDRASGTRKHAHRYTIIASAPQHDVDDASITAELEALCASHEPQGTLLLGFDWPDPSNPHADDGEVDWADPGSVETSQWFADFKTQIKTQITLCAELGASEIVLLTIEGGLVCDLTAGALPELSREAQEEMSADGVSAAHVRVSIEDIEYSNFRERYSAQRKVAPVSLEAASEIESDWQRWIAVLAAAPTLPPNRLLEDILNTQTGAEQQMLTSHMAKFVPSTGLRAFVGLLSSSERGSISIQARAERWFTKLTSVPQFDELWSHWQRSAAGFLSSKLHSQQLFLHLATDSSAVHAPATRSAPSEPKDTKSQAAPQRRHRMCSIAKLKRQVARWIFPALIVLLYLYRACRCFYYIGALEDMARSTVTFRAVPSRYDRDDLGACLACAGLLQPICVPCVHPGLYVCLVSIRAQVSVASCRVVSAVQNYSVPILYGVMHANLVTFGLLPLTYCRTIIRVLSKSPTLDYMLHLDRLGVWHRSLGYALSGGILAGALIWWVALGMSCLRDRTSCEAFYPRGSYISLFHNPDAVLFLRELVSLSMISLVLLSSLVFDLNIGSLARGRLCDLLWCRRSSGRGCSAAGTCGKYEIFYYSHVCVAFVMVSLAFASRFDVFFPTMPCYLLYFCDLLYTTLFDVYCVRPEVGALLFNEPRSIKLRLSNRDAVRSMCGCLCLPTCRNRCCPQRFRYKAGQTLFIKVRGISRVEWHPFSIASIPTDGAVELLMDVHGDGSWTHALYEAVEACGLADKPQQALKDALKEVLIMGPYGSSFEHFASSETVVVISGGSGLASSLSVLRQACAQEIALAAATQRIGAAKLNSVKRELKKHKPKELFARYAQTSNALMTFDEFKRAVLEECHAMPIRDLKALFSAVDTDTSGEISIRQLTEFVWGAADPNDLDDVSHASDSSPQHPRLHFVWTVRHANHLLWCWRDLKQTLVELEAHTSGESAFQHLDNWLTVDVHVTESGTDAAQSNFQKLLLMEQSQAGNRVGKWLVSRLKQRRPDWPSMLNKVYMDTAASTVQVFCCAGPAVADGVRSAASAFNSQHSLCEIKVSGENFSDGRAGPPVAFQSLLQMGKQLHSTDLVGEIGQLAQRAAVYYSAWSEVVAAAKRTLRSRQPLDETKAASMQARIAEVQELLQFVETADLLNASEDHRRVVSDNLELQRLFILGSLLVGDDQRNDVVKKISLHTMKSVRPSEAMPRPGVGLVGPLKDAGFERTYHFLPVDLPDAATYRVADYCDNDPDRAILGAGSFGTAYRMLRLDDTAGATPSVFAVKVSREGQVEQAEREATISQDLTQSIGEHVVRTHTHFRVREGAQTCVCTVMDVAELGTVFDYIKRWSNSDSFEDRAIVWWMTLQMATGLCAMHGGWFEDDAETGRPYRRSIEHRDIKSDNIFVT